MISKADIYRIAMRLIEEHGDAAEMAAILNVDPLLRQIHIRNLVLAAITELRQNDKPPN